MIACFGIALLALLLVWACALLIAILNGTPQPYKMTFEEEVEWLMAQGLSREEAEEIANL